MANLFTILFAFFCMGEETTHQTSANVQEVTTTYYLIRHAEKEVSNPSVPDPSLSMEGRERIRKWIVNFKEIPLDVVYTTPYKRTEETAALIAESRGLPVKHYDPRNLNDPQFQNSTIGKNILVVGHSNTNPAFVNKLLNESRYAPVNEEEYGSLFTVKIDASGEAVSSVEYVN